MTDNHKIQFLNLLNHFKITKGSNIYVGIDILRIAKLLKYNSKNLHNLADTILKFLMKHVGKSGTIVIPVFNFECVSQNKFDRKNSVGQSGMFGNLLLKKFYKFRTRHPMYSFLVFGKKSKLYLKKDNIGATDKNSLWKNFNEDNFELITLGHHYVRSLTHVHYLENLINVNYRENKIFKVSYKDINGKVFVKNYSFFARKLDVCEFSSITKKCDKVMFNLKIADFLYNNGLICFKLNLNKASKLILKSIKKNSNDLLSFIKVGETFKNKTILGNDNGAVFDLEKKYLLKKKIIYKL
tara:strand:+ start:698 stop:1588 length:891 start_codon:yes stop_codon:yes gene_type:complete